MLSANNSIQVSISVKNNYYVHYYRNALQQSIATMWGAETFPWMVAVGLLEGDNGLPSLLCSGAAVSKFVVLVPAHCITGAQKSRVVILSNHYRYMVIIFSFSIYRAYPQITNTSFH